MIWLQENLSIMLARHALTALVFVIGLSLSAYVYVDRTKRTAADQLSRLEDEAKNYEFLLQQRLDQYASANRALSAFFSASISVQPVEFDNYIRASQLFERLQGMSSFGYLPKVPAGQVDRFETEAGRLFPGYRIPQRRDGVAAYFPLLYGQHAADPTRINQLRGFDYSAIPVRWAAMQEADARDGPVATAAHAALRDPQRRRVVLIFSPVRRPMPAVGQHGNLNGFIFSSVYTEPLFRDFDNGRMAQYFDLEVFENKVSRENLIFDGDSVPHALKAGAIDTLAHRAKV